MTTVILCGGAGTRLWPLSRNAMPKQFADIFPDNTLFEATVQRNFDFDSDFLVAANESQSELATKQLAACGVTEFKLLVEPIGRNTAPAIALSCMMLARDEIVLVVPSDHVIRGQEEYKAAISRGIELAKKGRLVTFGIKPSYAETGYGYIEVDDGKVLSFKEKPNKATAEEYLASGNFFWNSGMFCFKAGVFLDELSLHSPDCFKACLSVKKHSFSEKTFAPYVEDMRAIPSISVDYAVMEKSKKISCVACPVEMGWNDLGSFDSIYDEMLRENVAVSQGNAVSGCQSALFTDSINNLVFTSNRKIVLVGVDDLVVVDTPDAVLIGKKGRTQSVKDAVEKLKKTDPGLL